MALSEVKSDKWEFSNLFEYLSTGWFADFDIICGNFTFKAHRAIVCQKSTYFDKMNSENWVVGGKGARATFNDWDPAIIARLLIFLYRGSYPELDVSASGIQQFSKIEDPFRTLGNQESLHAQMYALAAAIDIPELYDISRAAFKKHYDHSTHFARDDWPDLVEYIYTSTAPVDNHLRKLVLLGAKVATTFEHDQVYDANLAQALRLVPDFAFEMITTNVCSDTDV